MFRPVQAPFDECFQFVLVHPIGHKNQIRQNPTSAHAGPPRCKSTGIDAPSKNNFQGTPNVRESHRAGRLQGPHRADFGGPRLRARFVVSAPTKTGIARSVAGSPGVRGCFSCCAAQTKRRGPEADRNGLERGPHPRASSAGQFDPSRTF